MRENIKSGSHGTKHRELGHGLAHAMWRHAQHGRGRWRGGHGRKREFGFGEGPGSWGGPPHGGHGGPDGIGGRHRERLERGLLRYIILDILKDGPRHGYEVIKQLEEKTGGQYAPSPGTLYPTLQYLDDLGLVRADQETERKTYHLTDAGRSELEGHAELVKHFWTRFDDRTPAGVSKHEIEFLHDALHDLRRTTHSGVHMVMQGGNPDTLRKIRRALEQCQNDLREIIASGASGQNPMPETGKEGASPRQDPSEF